MEVIALTGLPEYPKVPQPSKLAPPAEDPSVKDGLDPDRNR